MFGHLHASRRLDFRWFRSAFLAVGLAAAVGLVSSGPLPAQSSSGTIQGTIRDSSGAVVPGATVHITATATSVSVDVAANEVGFYIAPALVPGEYKILAQAPGFQKWDGHMVLRGAQTANLDIPLAVGSSETSIVVIADATPLVTTDNGTVSSTLDRNRIEQLPMNGRDISGLVNSTVPGVYYDGTGIRIDGLTWDAFEFVQDGAAITDRDLGGVQQERLPGLESIKEVRIEINSSSAKFDRPGTGIISTQNGTNQIHGSLFETNRDNGYGLARARQDNYTHAPQLIRNEFGGSVGGPVYLPAFGANGRRWYRGKGKTFFFASWEGLELRQGVTKSFSMPTMAMRSGDWSSLTNSLGQHLTIYDPLSTTSTGSRTPFVNNQIPISRISPLAKTLYAVTPQPTESAVNPLVGNNWIGVTPNNESDKMFTVRLDQNFGERDKAYFRFSRGNRSKNYLGYNGYGPQTTDLSANITYAPNYNDSGSLSWTHVFSPVFFSETVVSTNYTGASYYTGPDPSVAYATKLGLPNNFGQTGYPNITGLGFTSQYGQNDNTRASMQFISVIDQNFTRVQGRHQLQFGARYRHERLHVQPDEAVASQVQFSNMATALLNPTSGNAEAAISTSGFAGADFFLGYASSYTVNQNMTWYRFRDQEYATYFQDDFKVNSRLTVNLGLRWEVHPGMHEGEGAMDAFDLQNHAIVTQAPLARLAQLGYTTASIMKMYQNLGVKFETPEQAGMSSGIWNTYWKSFAPRVGIAWKAVDGQRPTMIRAGYGVYSYPPPLRNFYSSIKGDPPFQSTYTLNFFNAAQSPDGLPNYILRSVPTIIAGQNSANVIDINNPTAITPGGFQVQTLDPKYPPTYVHQWNLTVEREIAFHTVVSANYTGNHGTNLEQFWSYNDAPPDYVWYTTTGKAKPSGTYWNTLERPYDSQVYGTVEIQRKTGYSNDNSFKLQAQRLFRNGVAFQFYYTMQNAFRMGGNGWRDSTIYPVTAFEPGTVPTDWNALNKYLNYTRDPAIPKHQFSWNWLADIPFGKGKALLNRNSRLLNALVGGWQFAGTGSARRGWWTPTLSDYVLSDVKTYGTSQPIVDCRSGACQRGYLWYNGYIAPAYVNTTNGVTGLPADYTYAHQPINAPNCSNASLCGTNNVILTLANGSQVSTVYQMGTNNLANPWHKVVFAGPFNWTMNTSLFKTFKLAERSSLRLQGDAFNVLNMPGLSNPDTTTGILSLQNSNNSPRTIQFTVRLTW